jgi:hypothetical protein
MKSKYIIFNYNKTRDYQIKTQSFFVFRYFHVILAQFI